MRVMLLLVFAACAAPPEVSGTWEGASANAEGWVLELAPNGSCRWTVTQGTLDLSYRFNPAASPPQLDLFGFTARPLAGRTLYGIVEFDGDDSFRWDAEPGLPDSASARPTRFVEGQTRVMRRRPR